MDQLVADVQTFGLAAKKYLLATASVFCASATVSLCFSEGSKMESGKVQIYAIASSTVLGLSANLLVNNTKPHLTFVLKMLKLK